VTIGYLLIPQEKLVLCEKQFLHAVGCFSLTTAVFAGGIFDQRGVASVVALLG